MPRTEEELIKNLQEELKTEKAVSAAAMKIAKHWQRLFFSGVDRSLYGEVLEEKLRAARKI